MFRYIWLCIVSLIPFVGFGHVRGLLDWVYGFIFYLFCYFLFGFYASVTKHDTRKTIIIFFIPLVAYPILLFFEEKEYYYPILAPSIFLTGLAGYILGFFFLRHKFVLGIALAFIVFTQVVASNSILPSHFFNKMIHSKSLSHLEGRKLDLYFNDLDGNSVDSSYFKNKVVVLDFWFTGCEACVVKHREYEKLYLMFKNNPEVIIASVVDGRYSSRQETKSFLKKNKYSFKTFYDSDGSFSHTNKLDLEGYPVEIRVNRSGEIIGTVLGFGLKNIWYSNAVEVINNQIKNDRFSTQ